MELEGLEKYIHIFFINGPVDDPNSTELQLHSHTKLKDSGPMGNGHLYIYHNINTNETQEFYYDEIYKKNLFGETYVGDNNPQRNGRYDYGQAPQDFIDYGAYRHDKAYDKFGAEGNDAAVNNLDVINADKELLKFSELGMLIYKLGASDPITGNKASFDLYLKSLAVALYFTPIVYAKQKALDYIKEQVNSTDKSVSEILKEYNSKFNTKFTTNKTRKEFTEEQ
jgi:hypothetical protein